MKRVVITGMGAVSPFGLSVAELLKGLQAHQSGVVSLRETLEPAMTDLTCLVGAPLPEPLDVRQVPRKYRRSMGPLAMLAWVATQEALEQAGLADADLADGQTGLFYGSSLGSAFALEENFDIFLNEKRVGPLKAGMFFKVMSHSCAANLAHAFGVTGRVLSTNAACASSTLALGLGFESIRSGAQQRVLCGGAEELHPTVVATFDNLQAASSHFNDRPHCTPRPFDRDRDGTVCAEGAGTIVLESLEAAQARGAHILGEIEGFATNTDGRNLAQPHRGSIVRCLHNALDNAGVMPDGIDYINAHATGTVLGDVAEAEAICEVFPAPASPSVSALKGHLGHTLGASGALETIATVDMLRQGYLLPGLNLDHPAEGCEGLCLVREQQNRQVHRAMKNSFAFGGTNAVLILKRFDA